MMIENLLETIAQQNPYSYDEICWAYERLRSIDAVLVAVELAWVTECRFSEAIELISTNCQNRAAAAATTTALYTGRS